MPLPLFEDPTYAYANHYIISTSTLSSKNVLIGGFGPVVQDGYGIGYNAYDEELSCNVLTYPTRDGAEFVKNFEHALHDIHDVICGESVPK